MSSPTSTGRDSSSSGGRVSGEITSPRLVNTVRNQGRRRRSPSSRPTFTGCEVSSSGGNLVGANVSRRLPTSDLQSGCVRLAGGSKSSGISGCAAGEGGAEYQVSAAFEREGLTIQITPSAAPAHALPRNP